MANEPQGRNGSLHRRDRRRAGKPRPGGFLCKQPQVSPLLASRLKDCCVLLALPWRTVWKPQRSVVTFVGLELDSVAAGAGFDLSSPLRPGSGERL